MIYKNKGNYSKAGKYYYWALGMKSKVNAKTDVGLLKTAAEALYKDNKKDEASQLINLFLEHKKPIQIITGISNLQDNKRAPLYTDNVDSELREVIPESYEFIPSFRQNTCKDGKHAKILFIHIPKCGGHTSAPNF